MTGHIVFGHYLLFLNINCDYPDINNLNSVYNRYNPSDSRLEKGNKFSKSEFNGSFVVTRLSGLDKQTENMWLVDETFEFRKMT